MLSLRFIVFLLCSTYLVQGQETSSNGIQNLMSSLTASASNMVKSIAQEDYDLYLELVHPAVIESHGDEAEFIKNLEAKKLATLESGIQLISATLQKEPYDILGERNTYQTIIPFEYIIEIDGIQYKGLHYLFAITPQKEISWTFVELENLDENGIRYLINEYSDLLKFPVIKYPKIIE